MIPILLLALALASPAAAQTRLDGFPALYDVVSDGDVTARDWPNETGYRVGVVPAGSAPVEVLLAEASLGWAMINVGERTGWVRLSALRRQPGQWEDFALPANLTCLGTEPGWQLAVSNGNAVLSGQELAETAFGGVASQHAIGRGDRWSLAADGGLVAVVAKGVCLDGMSDRQYGLSVDVLVPRDGALPDHLAGCCTLAR